VQNFISAWKEALYFLNAAREIGGPKDEEILYHLWTVNRKLERYPEMERLTLELHQRYPSSLFLVEILDQWKAVKPPSPIAWTYSARAAVASNKYLNDRFTNRVQGEARQQSGPHLFRERASMSLASKWNERVLHGFQTNVGGEYDYKGFAAEADWGVSYETPTALVLTNDRQSILVDSNWNFAQGRLSLGYSYTTHGGWNLGANASFMQLNEDWRVADLSHSQSFLIENFILIAFFDFQKHWISMPWTTSNDSTGAEESRLRLAGMYTFTASLTPYFSWGKHSFGVGPAYYLSRSRTAGLYAQTLAFSRVEWVHSLAATASYSYELRPWCRAALTGSSGYDFKRGSQPDWVYSADAGVSFSF